MVYCFRVKEERFWRNYFYRVSLIKQSSQLSTLAQAGKSYTTVLGIVRRKATESRTDVCYHFVFYPEELVIQF